MIKKWDKSKDTVSTKDLVVDVSRKPILLPTIKSEVSYHKIVLESNTPTKEIEKDVGKENVLIVLSLNRLDDKHLKKDMSLVAPNSFDDIWALSAFPKTIPSLSEIPKIILISQRVQEFASYENGVLVRFGGISTGKKSTPTASKLFFTNWKGKLVTSSIDDGWIKKPFSIS